MTEENIENKANSGWIQIGVSSFMTSEYVEFCCFGDLKNKANQSQFITAEDRTRKSEERMEKSHFLVHI